jgi:hypothetical protein
MEANMADREIHHYSSGGGGTSAMLGVILGALLVIGGLFYFFGDWGGSKVSVNVPSPPATTGSR